MAAPDALDLDAVERMIDDHRLGNLEPGLAYGVVQGGHLVHSGGRGWSRQAAAGSALPDADTVFRIASMTKSFTAATVLLLRDQRLLRLDDEVTTYVPEIAELSPPTDDAPPLTVRSLLTMTAGFPTDDPWGDRQQDLPEDDFTRLLVGGLSFAWTPGTAFEYSNLSYALLGRVIAAATGGPYAEAVTRRLLGPLGMASTAFTHAGVPGERLAQGYRRTASGWDAVPFAGNGAFASMGGLFSTVRDLARWVGGLAGAFPPRDGGGPDSGGPDSGGPDSAHPLCRASRRELQLPHVGLPPAVIWHSITEAPTVRGAAYGYGLVVERDPRFGTLVSHSGGYPGFGSHMRWHPGSGLGVIVLGNATYTPVPRLGGRILDALLAGRPGVWIGGPGSSPTPAPSSMTRATAIARERVNQLITSWDDELAGRLLAANVDLDEPLESRRRAWLGLTRTLGPLVPDDDAPITSGSPAQCAWWLRGPQGRVRVEIRLSPELPPKVQTLTVTGVPDPPALHREVAEAVAAVLGEADPRWPDGLPLAGPNEPAHLLDRLRVATAWAGRSRVAEVIACDGGREATFRLDGERTSLLLSITADSANGTVIDVRLTPRLP